ncbi:MAG: rhomboid family intramembrane serine protease [Planctomycetota bacterium]|nr:rhomboid family intramembrane serine protease [Planctomycetota bacterium]
MSAMFLHGDIFHLLFNMLFLFVFGRGVEDVLGYRRFAVLYFISGWFGSVLFSLMESNPYIPSVGASGAISGVLGAYLVLLPGYKVTTLFTYWTVVRLITVPAKVIIGIWIAFQFLYALLFSAIETGVAYTAHLGGIAAGVVVAIFVKKYFLPEESRFLYETPKESFFQRYHSQLTDGIYSSSPPYKQESLPKNPKVSDPFEDFFRKQNDDV